MTLKEIEEQLKAAYEAPIDAEGNNTIFALLPRLHYNELPLELQEKVDETFTIEKIKGFLNDSVKNNLLSSIEADPAKLDKDIIAAIHNSIYNITRDEVEEDKAEVCLFSCDFLNAWKEQTHTATPTAATDPGEAKKEYAQLKAAKIDSIDYPISKDYRYLFNIVPWEEKYYEEIDGQFRFHLDVARKGEKPIDTTYAFNFSLLDDVTIPKKLTPYDKLVYTAIASLYERGYDTMNLQMIYNAMGGLSKVGKIARSTINKSIIKFLGTTITINNREEVKKHNREDYSMTCNMIYGAIVTQKINGQISESLLKVFKSPVLFKIAKDKKQITTLDIKLLQFPGNKTDNNIQLANYIIEAVLDIKDKKRNSKMLYKTICERIGVKSKATAYRLPEKIKELLEHFKKCGFIEGFQETKEKDGVILTVKPAKDT